MNNHYIKEILTDDECDIINNILKANNIVSIFENNMWIAGGFPRIIQYAKLNNLDLKKCLNEYFNCTKGDIDVFSSSENDINQFLDRHTCDFLYRSPFAINISNNLEHNINVQIVNQFFYNSFESCLNSFDFTNCKYLLYSEKEKYVLLKDARADFFTKEKVLNIDACVSPLLPQRIVKYFNKHKMKSLSNSKETKQSLEEYLFKTAADSWDDKFYIMGDLREIADVYVKRLHDKIGLTNNQLSILIGKFSDPQYVKIRRNYGFYLEYAGSKDWATGQIQNNSIQTR